MSVSISMVTASPSSRPSPASDSQYSGEIAPRGYVEGELVQLVPDGQIRSDIILQETMTGSGMIIDSSKNALSTVVHAPAMAACPEG